MIDKGMNEMDTPMQRLYNATFLHSDICVSGFVVFACCADACKLTKGQMKSERKKIQTDRVLLQGERNFVLPTEGGNQEVLCLKLDFLPLWLVKISITPAIINTIFYICPATKLLKQQLKQVLSDCVCVLAVLNDILFCVIINTQIKTFNFRPIA